MTNEELLEEAKKRYPIGTEFISALKCPDPAKCTVTGHNVDKVQGRTIVWGGKQGFLYDDGKWAEIVSKPEPQYEVGKWYKVKWRYLDNPIYIKPTHIQNNTVACDGDNSIWISRPSEYIYRNSHYALKDLELLSQVTDLSEIQQYLPDGHPDKFNTNIPLIKDGIYVAEFLDKEYELYSSIFTCLETNTYRQKDKLYLSKDVFKKDDNGTWAVNSYKIKFRNPTTQELERYFRFTNILPGYAASLKEELNNNLKTNKNEETTTRDTTSVKVQRPNIKIGTANSIRGNGLNCSRSKIQLGSNNSYNQKRFSSCKSRVS